jgi:RNA polymerase sigma-70 factor, ECF subfamily
MLEFGSISLVWPRFARHMSPQGSLSGAAGVTDEALFERTCRDDDHAAFSELVTRYRVRVIALVRRMLTSSQTAIDPEDIAQEAFLDAYRRRQTFRRGAQFRPWLYGIAVNRCVDKIRVMDRESTLTLLPSDEASESVIASAEMAPLETVIRSQEISDIDREITHLPAKLRAVLVLRYVDDLSYEEIASACALPIGTVKTHLFRARAELKRRLEDER